MKVLMLTLRRRVTRNLIRGLCSGLLVAALLSVAPRGRADDQSTASTAQQPDAAAAPPVYHRGDPVSVPKLIHSVTPKYTKAAKKKKITGVCVIKLIVGVDGSPRNLTVVRSIAEGLSGDRQDAAKSLDQQAMEAVQQYRFEPSELNGKPVAVEINVEVHFHLYGW